MDSRWLENVIHSFRTTGEVLPSFDRTLDALAAAPPDKLASLRLPADAVEERTEAAAFVIHALRETLHDHVLDAQEADAIESLTFAFGFEEGDLLALQAPMIRAFVSAEIESMLADDQIDDLELLKKSGLQRALGLGYDQFLYLAQDGMRPVVERILDDARHGHRHSLERLKTLHTFVMIDTAALEAVWPTSPGG